MPEDELTHEIKTLAQTIMATENEDVRDTADQLVRDYRGRIAVINGLDAVDRMTQGDAEAVEERLQERMRKAREQMRDSLRRLVEWGRESGRICSKRLSAMRIEFGKHAMAVLFGNTGLSRTISRTFQESH